jgi:hypothetical protein
MKGKFRGNGKNARKKRLRLANNHNTTNGNQRNDSFVNYSDTNEFALPILCPDVMRVKLVFAYNSAVGGISTQAYTFSGNSIYDPDPLVGGTSVSGFLEWMKFYTYYMVFKSDFEVRAVPDLTGSANAKVFEIVTVPDTLSSSAYTTNATIAAKYMKRGMVVDEGDNFSIVRNSMTTAKMWGTQPGFSWQTLGTSTSNPAAQWYWHVIYRPMQNGGNVTALVNYRIVYHTELRRRIDTVELAIEHEERYSQDIDGCIVTDGIITDTIVRGEKIRLTEVKKVPQFGSETIGSLTGNNLASPNPFPKSAY